MSPSAHIIETSELEQQVLPGETVRVVKEVLRIDGTVPLFMVRKWCPDRPQRAPVLLVHGLAQNRYSWHTSQFSMSAWLAALDGTPGIWNSGGMGGVGGGREWRHVFSRLRGRRAPCRKRHRRALFLGGTLHGRWCHLRCGNPTTHPFHTASPGHRRNRRCVFFLVELYDCCGCWVG